ncbi:MAG: tRNA uridine-5-carboxymethylaminomethyl(34) synthesis GTPase MnmE [Roseiarcus sp.]|jgi:tRNA modification GTPase
MVDARPLYRHRDTIFALASGAGRAAIAIVRVSGPACASALEALAPSARFADRVATLTALRDPVTREPLDSALVIRFCAPRSFTGEEMAELQATGGRAVVAGIVGALAKIPGLRPAEPGEFAWRAFENGKLDLSEVEGLADLVDAETAAQRRQALRVAGGALSRETEAIRAKLLEAMAILEAQIDFSDVEDVDALSLEAARAVVAEAARRIEAALAGAAAGARLREGFVVVIAGPPNVGKSTLMNALARRDVSIVSPIPGATRDLVEVPLELRGYPVTLVDTAGMRDSDDPIEREGVARARRRAEEADLTLWLSEAAEPIEARLPGAGPVIAVLTKADLRPAQGIERASAAAAGRRDDPSRRPLLAAPRPPIAISALSGAGIETLLDAVADLAEERMAGPAPALIALERHRAAFADALGALERALDPARGELELVAEDLRLAARALQRIAGRIDVEDVLGDIFSRLCVGK